MLETLFLWLGNSLPRFKLCDKLRFRFYRLAGMRFGGKNVIFGPLVVRPIGGAKKIQIGKGTFLNTEVRFGAASSVEIGAKCQIATRVCFETVGHNLVFDTEKNSRGTWSKPIKLGDRVWVGANVVILPGITVGEGAVIAAGAVVTKDVLPYTLVGGVPAKKIRTIESDA